MIMRALSVAMLGFIFWKCWGGTAIGGRRLARCGRVAIVLQHGFERAAELGRSPNAKTRRAWLRAGFRRNKSL
jgi:hypothetical protein